MNKKQTLQNLIDEIIEEFDKKFACYSLRGGKPNTTCMKFLRQSLLKIAQVTAEVGKLKKKGMIINGKRALAIGDNYFNQAVQQQQNQLKEFLGEYYDKKSKNN